MLAIVEAIRLWRPYLLGRKLFIQTDQHSLKYFLDQRVVMPEQQNWVAKLMGYGYEIIYHLGCENSVVDTLSRKPNSPVLHHLHVATVTLWDEIKNAYERDSHIQSVDRVAKAQPEGPYSQLQGLWLFKRRVVIPSCGTLRTKLLHEAHNTKIGGHSSVLRTFKWLAQQFYWPKMHQSIQDYVKHCEVNLETSINRMKRTADQRRRDVTFEVGDMVFLKLHPYRQQSIFKRVHQKLASRFYRPYPIVQKIGAVAYQLQLPKGARIHPIFHVSLLKKFVGDLVVPSEELPPVNDKGIIILEPQQIWDICWVKRGNKFEAESLVQWKRLPIKEATWETNQSLKEQFPSVDLEDKSPLNGGGIVTPRRSKRGLKPNPKYQG
ncbi:hypothetical protein F0562_028291 [Nyssa sinensis]|uniref:Chromo domain-containing protein n=1 Tax=Nyssa sinensis TaxID=561372 RepID=A0A5J5B617_9ASTE|nr:hypothetical protein F0562_028291 [Nyssa sinensis]